MANTVESFLAEPLTAQSNALQALWHLAHGDWNSAHEAAQSSEDTDAAWVHALLHRHEGDAANARYWYRRAGRPVFHGSLADEQQAMLQALLEATA